MTYWQKTVKLSGSCPADGKILHQEFLAMSVQKTHHLHRKFRHIQEIKSDKVRVKRHQTGLKNQGLDNATSN